LSKKLVCHRCGHTQDLFLFCPKCQSPNLKFIGTGIEKVVAELKKSFPGQKISKIDRETTLGAGDDFSDSNIIVGTQFALSTLAWQNIGLVGVINADSLFYIPDYRSLERTFNLLSKLAINISNQAIPQKLIIQSFAPENIIYKALKNWNRESFYQSELAERKDFNYPPFCKLIKLIYQNYEFNSGQQEIEAIYKNLLKANLDLENIIINAPQLAYGQQVRGRFRWHLIIKILQKDLDLKFLNQLPDSLIIDVDPENLL
jgi:primosomal protein N' (replication factor Y)